MADDVTKQERDSGSRNNFSSSGARAYRARPGGVRRNAAICLLALVGAVVSCTPPAADDGFRTKLASGCKTQTDCDALAQEAQDRLLGCIKASSGGESDCADQQHDKSWAGELQSSRREASAKVNADNHAQVENQQSLAADAMAQLRRDQKRTNISCSDLAEFEAASTATHDPDVAEGYRVLARRRREDSIQPFLFTIKHRTQLNTDFRRAGNLEDVRKGVPAVKAAVEELRCYDASGAAKVQAEVDAWATALEKALSDEETCRATPKCMSDRASTPLCEAIGDRREANQEMAKERRNPAGVVDLNVLHDLGQRIQDDDSQIAELRKKFTATAHKPFNDASCPRNASQCCDTLEALTKARDADDATRERYRQAALSCKGGAFAEMRMKSAGLRTPGTCNGS